MGFALLKRAHPKHALMKRVLCALLAVLPAAASNALACDLERPSGVVPCMRATVDRLPLNAIQLIGTHNSYKRAIPPDELAAHRAVDAAGAEGLDYAHPTLAAQLDMGVRVLELDVYRDPDGGRFLAPPGAHRRGYTAPPWSGADLARMRAPGFKVMHLHDIDFRSTCVTFVQCLEEVDRWSRAHSWHAPIMISVNAKDGQGGAGAIPALAFDATAFDALDAEARSGIASSRRFEPAQLPGGDARPRSAAWPTLGDMRGKIVLVLDEDARKRAVYRSRDAAPAMFVASDRMEDDSALMVLNDPVAQQDQIAAALHAGRLVRTRADADTREARAGDMRRRDAAFASGAQFISTDYPLPDPHWPSYDVRFPSGGYVRCAPTHSACADLQEP